MAFVDEAQGSGWRSVGRRGGRVFIRIDRQSRFQGLALKRAVRFLLLLMGGRQIFASGWLLLPAKQPVEQAPFCFEAGDAFALVFAHHKSRSIFKPLLLPSP